MPKLSIVIKSLSSSIVVRSDNQNDISLLKSSKFLKRYIPSYSIMEESGISTDCALYIKRGQAKIIINYPKAYYYNKKYDEKDIVSLAEFLLERARQEKELYCLHGSACVIENKAIIFWGGASGMGKTLLCQKLKQNFNAEFIADEKIILNLKKIEIVGGVGTAYSKNNKFIDLQVDSLKPIPISFFIYPFLDGNNKNNLEFIIWDSEKFRWHMYEELNRKIRGTSRTFFSGAEPILPLDTIKIARKRIKAIHLLSKKIKNYQMHGNSDAICRKIIKIMRQKKQ